MQKRILASIVGIGVALGACATGWAQTYSNAVAGLNPAGYWPLNETAQPPQVLNLTATNSGSAGAAGNGYYGGWYQQSGNQWYLTNNIVMESGPISGDQAMNCQSVPGQYIILPRNTNGVANPAVTITAPFSVEAWVNMGTISRGLLSIVSEGGETTMNIGGPNPTNQFYGGPASGWDGFTLGAYQNYFFFNCYVTNGVGYKSHELDLPHPTGGGLVVGQWVHVVCTLNTGGVMTMYTNGIQAGGTVTIPANGKGLRYVVDPTSPLIIGAGPVEPVGYGNGFQGGLAEVAIYNQALGSSQVLTHYQAASSVASYTNAVIADGPTLYFRMNDGQTQTNAGYPSSLFPVANNYGSLGASANGVYQQGTTPGMSGPPFAGFGSNSKSVAINGWLGAVDVGSSNLPSSLNPTGAVPLSVVAWYRTGPADNPGRFQEIVGHSDSSYRLSLGQNTVVGENHFNAGPGPELQASTAAQVITNGFALNDGQWHMVAGVSDGTNEYLYLDGSLALSGNNPTGINIAGTSADLLLGGDPEYTYPTWGGPYNSIRTLDGNIAQVSYFTNALSAAQIQLLFNAAGVPPFIVNQPISSITANQGQSVTVSSVIRGSGVTYQWYQNGVAVSGQTNATLSYVPAVASDSGSYELIASSSYGSVTSSIVTLTIFGPPVLMGQSPTQLEIFSGSSPTLYVMASGENPVYQWNVGGTSIPGATNSTYKVPDITASGTYGCTVTNVLGTTNIASIAIQVLADPTAPYPAQVLANGPIAYYRLDEAPGATTAYDYVGGFNSDYTNVLTGNVGGGGYLPSGYAPQSDPNEACSIFGYDNPPNNLAGDVTPFPNFGTPSGSNAEFTVEAWINETDFKGSGNCIVGLGYGGGGEQFVLDSGAISGTSAFLRFFVRNAAGASIGASSSYSVVNDGNWHHVVGVCDEAGGHLYLYLDGTNIATTAIASGSGLQASMMPLTIGARESANNNPTNYDFQFYGGIDDVSLYNKALSAAQVLTDYNAAGFAPSSVQVQPSNLTTNQGATAVFTATAQGTQPLTYQWTDNHGTLISWATGPTLALTNVQPTQAGNYTVTIGNGYGSVNASATLNVTQVPEIVQDIEPTNVITYAGYPVTLSILASGSPPLHYQWYQDGLGVSGATNTSFSFGALSGTNTYYCAVTNIYSAGSPLISGTATVVGEGGRGTLAQADFNSRLKITFSGYTNSETLQFFPALVRLGTNLVGFSYGEFAGAGGSDLRFADSTGTNELPYEVVQWNGSNGVSTVWVQVPSLSGGTNNYIYAYWGNSADATQPAYTTNGTVWEPASFLGLPDYEVVYHLQQTSFPYLDSTLNYPATNGVVTTPAAGIVGNGALFSGGSYLNAGDVNLGNQFTMSAWVNLSTSEYNIQGVWCNGPGGYATPEANLFINDYYPQSGVNNPADGALLFGDDDSQPETATGLVTSNQWHLVTAVINRTVPSIQFYVDGTPSSVVAGGNATSDFPTNLDMNLGRFNNGSFPLTGIMDEARIHGGVDDANWVWADYQTVANNSAFSTYSSVTNTIVLPITLTIRNVGDQVILNWPEGTLQSASDVNGPFSNVPGATPPYTNTVSGAQQYYRVQAQF